jgi:hypothetical protein
VGRELVHDDVQLASSGLPLDDGLQEGDECRARVTRRGVAHDFAVRVFSAAWSDSVPWR